MTNPKLKAIAHKSAENLKVLIEEHASDIMDAIAESDETTSFSLNHTIKIDLGKNKQTDKLAFSVKHSDEIEGLLPDPDQPEMFRDND